MMTRMVTARSNAAILFLFFLSTMRNTVFARRTADKFFKSDIKILTAVETNYKCNFNKLLELFGTKRLNINTTVSVWPTLLIVLNAWKMVGYGSVVYLSAITGIDPGLYEAAELDGANKWQQIFHITVPSLLSTIIIMTLLAVGRIFRGDFSMFYQLVGNNGVLLRETDILDTYIYRSMLGNSQLGMTAAAGLYQR